MHSLILFVMFAIQTYTRVCINIFFKGLLSEKTYEKLILTAVEIWWQVSRRSRRTEPYKFCRKHRLFLQTVSQVWTNILKIHFLLSTLFCKWPCPWTLTLWKVFVPDIRQTALNRRLEWLLKKIKYSLVFTKEIYGLERAWYYKISK